jgi:hypothetical protein
MFWMSRFPHSKVGDGLAGNQAPDTFQGDASKSVGATEATANFQDFQSRQTSGRVVIGGDTVRQVLGSYGRFREDDAESVGLGVEGDLHEGLSEKVGVDGDDHDFRRLFHKNGANSLRGVYGAIPVSAEGEFFTRLLPSMGGGSPHAGSDRVFDFGNCETAAVRYP